MEVRNDKNVAFLHKGKVTLHYLENNGNEVGNSFEFPQKQYSYAITCVELASGFLIYGSRGGNIFIYHLDDGIPRLSDEFHHSAGIKRLWPSNLGTRLIFEDDSEVIYVYNPILQQAITVPEYVGIVEIALWDVDDNHIFVLSKDCEDFVYLYSTMSICCSKVIFLGVSRRTVGTYPVALQTGILTCQLENDAFEEAILETHVWTKRKVEGEAELKERFNQNLSLLHFKEAWNDAMLLKSKEVWNLLIDKALEQMEVEIAMKACQQANNLKRLMSLRPLEHVEDRSLLSGHIMVLFGDYDAAQEAFLKSSKPEAAVEMRKNLQQWDQALALAVELGSNSTEDIKWGYAQLLERRGEYRHSLIHYQHSLKACQLNSKRHSNAKAGVARTSIHVGDIWKGKQIAMECNDLRLYSDCARILEGLNLLQDAAELYEIGKQLENAAKLYITVKNYTRAYSLLEQLKNSKLYVEFANAMEADGKYSEASAAYEEAEDIENVVRLQLGPLKNPHAAFSVVYKSKSIVGALAVAKFCKSGGDYEKAIEFFIMAKRTEEAHQLAQLHEKMDVYTELVVDVASKEERLKLARYYETMGNYAQAATLFERCAETKQALQLYLQWGASEGIEQAIAMVGRVKSEVLTCQLFDYLKEETRAEKSKRHLYRLYTVVQQYDLASQTALYVAQQEQETGNYKSAHQLLLDCCKFLRLHGIQIPATLSTQLMLLHSYILVKTLIRLGEHRSSARMLIRIVRHISKFPAHVVQILTSAVIECQRSGLKKSAFEYASMLMNPEHRQVIAPVYKRKIEKIVRKPEKVEEEEPLSPCPVCSLPIPQTQLDCPACTTTLPFCIASGRHMEMDNWSICPACKFPALMTEISKMLEVEKMCPMCEENILPQHLSLLDHQTIQTSLQAYKIFL